MRIAVTGATGYVGGLVVAHALDQGHEVVGIDHQHPHLESSTTSHQGGQGGGASGSGGGMGSSRAYSFIQADLTDYAQVERALRGCEGVAHLAALRTPGDGQAATHNNNVVSSWNILRAAAELGIRRIAQASSINVIGLYWNDTIQIDYLPLDEAHPCRPDDPYSLSKQICEAQADTIVRRFPHMRIASLRLHMVVPSRERARRTSAATARRQLWGYTLERSCVRAFLLALTAEREGFRSGQHERFFVVEPEVASQEEETDVRVLLQREWDDVPVRAGLEGVKGLFDCSKAEKLLGWKSEGE